jgi:hypothetical protein
MAQKTLAKEVYATHKEAMLLPSVRSSKPNNLERSINATEKHLLGMQSNNLERSINATEKHLLGMQSMLYQALLLRPYTQGQAAAMAKTPNGQSYVINTQTKQPLVSPVLLHEMRALTRTNKSKL